MGIAGFIAFGGWLLALIQFVLKHFEGKKKKDEELLEKTLGYFERGTQARAIGISLIESVWLKRKKYLEVIVPVLVSQLNFLLTEAEGNRQEERNLIRLLCLIEKCLPYASDTTNETIEVSEAILHAGASPGKLDIPKPSLRLWYKKFSNGDTETFDAETEGS